MGAKKDLWQLYQGLLGYFSAIADKYESVGHLVGGGGGLILYRPEWFNSVLDKKTVYIAERLVSVKEIEQISKYIENGGTWLLTEERDAIMEREKARINHMTLNLKWRYQNELVISPCGNRYIGTCVFMLIVMVLQLYTYAKSNQILYFKYVPYITCQLYLNKVV